MNRTELVEAVAQRMDGDRRSAALAVEAVLDTVTATLSAGEKVALFGFGVFERVDRAARTARNPATGGTVEVPATAVPRFRPGQGLKDAVNGRTSGSAQRTRPQSTSAGAAEADSREREGERDGKTDRKADGKKAKVDKAKVKKADGKKAGRKKSDGKKRG